MFGVVTLTGYQVEDIRVAQIGEPYRVGAYEIELVGVDENLRGPNYFTTMATIAVREAESGRLISELNPERRIYPVAGMPTTEAGINNGFTRDVYVTLGDPQAGGGWAVRTWIKPFANWIWGGTIIMALGGLSSACRTGATASRRGGQGASRAARACRPNEVSRGPPPGAGHGGARAAVQPDEVLPDPVLEERARDISGGPALHRLPQRIHRRIERRTCPRPAPSGARTAGRRATATQEVVAYIVDRYGEYVLLAPADDGLHHRAVAAAPVLLLLGLGLSVAYIRSRVEAPPRRPRPTCRRTRPRG
jgi:hypothetical protein